MFPSSQLLGVQQFFSLPIRRSPLLTRTLHVHAERVRCCWRSAKRANERAHQLRERFLCARGREGVRRNNATKREPALFQGEHAHTRNVGVLLFGRRARARTQTHCHQSFFHRMFAPAYTRRPLLFACACTRLCHMFLRRASPAIAPFYLAGFRARSEHCCLHLFSLGY